MTTIEAGQRDLDAVVAEVLGDVPRATYWRELRQVLAERQRAVKADRDALPPDSPDRIPLEKRLEELREQIHVLSTEEAVTQFIEDSIRTSLLRPSPPGTLALNGGYYDDDEDYEE